MPDSLASVTAADLAASPSTGSFSIVLGRAAGASDVKRDSVGEADRKRMPRALEHLASGIRSSISRFPPIGARLAVLAALTLLATAPWLLRLDGSHPGSHLVGFRPHTPVDFPLAMLTSSNDRWLLTSALVGIALGIYQRHRLAVELVFWVALSLLVTNSRQLGLPVNLMFPNDALAIMLFLPIALACGGLVASLAQAANIARWPWAQRVVGVVLMASIGVWGGTQLVGIVNPICILARPADLSAIEWVRENTPVDSKFLINSFEWRPGAYAGSDAGYWLIPLADRRSSVPPLIYRLGDSEQMEAVESLAVATSQQPINPNALLPLLGEQGITHLFIGDRGGSLHPDHFTDAVGYRLAYSNGRAWVFEVDHSGLEMR